MADLTLTAVQVAAVYPDEAEIYDMIAAVAITAGQAVYQNSAGKAALADANAGSGADQFRGIALRGAGAGQAVSVLVRGHVYGYTLSGAYDSSVYLSDTAGALATTPSTTSPVRVGRVVSMSDSNLTKVLYVDARIVTVVPSGPRVFVSAEQTGTGSAQNVAHGFGVIPFAVIATPTDLTPATVGSYSAVMGSHDATNVVVTVTTGKKYVIVAFGG